MLIIIMADYYYLLLIIIIIIIIINLIAFSFMTFTYRRNSHCHGSDGRWRAFITQMYVCAGEA